MASPTQEEFIRSLTLAVRPSSLRAPVLTYSPVDEPLPIANPARAVIRPAPRQPVTRAMALFMANILLVGWVSATHLLRETALQDREKAALAALDLGDAKQDRSAIAAMPPDTARALIAKMRPAADDDLIETGSLPDIPHPRDTVGYALIDRALSPGSALSLRERRKLLDAVRDTSLLAWEMQMAHDMIATGAIAPRRSDAEPRQSRAQLFGQGDGAPVRSIDIHMDKPALRGSL